MSSPKPIYIQKSNRHAKIHAYLITEIIPDEKNEKNFTGVGRIMPEGTSNETEPFDFTGFDETCKRPVVGDLVFQPLSKLGGGNSWNTMENFEKYWELEGGPKKLEPIRPNWGRLSGTITGIDLRPMLPKKDQAEAPAVITAELAEGTFSIEVAANIVRRDNPKIGWHLISRDGNCAFVSPQEFTRMVFTAFHAQRQQD